MEKQENHCFIDLFAKGHPLELQKALIICFHGYSSTP